MCICLLKEEEEEEEVLNVNQETGQIIWYN
jgi:hypothetical protein